MKSTPLFSSSSSLIAISLILVSCQWLLSVKAACQQPDPNMFAMFEASRQPDTCSPQLDAAQRIIAQQLMESVTDQLNHKLFNKPRSCEQHPSHHGPSRTLRPSSFSDSEIDDYRHSHSHFHHSPLHNHPLQPTMDHGSCVQPTYCSKPPGVLFAPLASPSQHLYAKPKQLFPHPHPCRGHHDAQLLPVNATHGQCVNGRIRRLYPKHPSSLYEHRLPTVTEKVASTIATAADHIKSMLGISTAAHHSTHHNDLHHARQMAATKQQLRLLHAEASACPSREVMESALRTIDRLKRKLREARPCAAAVGSREYLQDQAENTALLRKLGQLTSEIHDINQNQLAPLIRGSAIIHDRQLATIRDTLEQIDKLQERRHQLEIQHELAMKRIVRERERVEEENRRRHQLEFEAQIQREHERMERTMLERERLEEEERTRREQRRRQKQEHERRMQEESQQREYIQQHAREEAQRQAQMYHHDSVMHPHPHLGPQPHPHPPFSPSSPYDRPIYPHPSHPSAPSYQPYASPYASYSPYSGPGGYGGSPSSEQLGQLAAHAMAQAASDKLHQLGHKAEMAMNKLTATPSGQAISGLASAALGSLTNNFQATPSQPTLLPSFSRGGGKIGHDFHVSTEAIPMDATHRLVMLNKNRFSATKMSIDKINKLRTSLDLMLYAAFVPKPGTRYPPGHKGDGYLIDPRNGFMISEEKVQDFDVEKMSMLYNGNEKELFIQLGDNRYRIIYEHHERSIDVIKDKMKYAVFALVLDKPCGLVNHGEVVKLHIRRVGATAPITFGGGKKIVVNGHETNRLTNLRFNAALRMLTADYLFDTQQSTQFMIPERMIPFFQEIASIPVLNIATVG